MSGEEFRENATCRTIKVSRDPLSFRSTRSCPRRLLEDADSVGGPASNVRPFTKEGSLPKRSHVVAHVNPEKYRMRILKYKNIGWQKYTLVTVPF